MPRVIGEITTRDYQDRAHDAVLRSWETSRGALVVMPCRTGKTALAAAVIHTFTRRTGKQALFLAHMDGLLGEDQAMGTFRRAGLSFSCDWGDKRLEDDRRYSKAQVVLSTRQSAVRRLPGRIESGRLDIGMIVCDEAHHGACDEYLRIFGMAPEAKLLGLTATPDRGDGVGLGGIFDGGVVYELTLFDALKMGAVVEPEILPVQCGIDFGKLKPKGDDYSDAELAEKIGPHLNRIAYVIKQAMGPWRRFIGFVPGVKCAEGLAKLLTDIGVPSEDISGKDNPETQRRLKEAHAEGRIRGLCCADLLIEGHDAPFLGGVVLARPTRSRGRYVQMASRGGTPFPPQKTKYLLLDLSLGSELHDLVHPAEIWAGPGIPEDVMEIARALIDTGEKKTVSEAVKEAMERKKEQIERRKLRVVQEPEHRHQIDLRGVRKRRPLSECGNDRRGRVAAIKNLFDEMSHQR